jgi:hypothetical protein
MNAASEVESAKIEASVDFQLKAALLQKRKYEYVLLREGLSSAHEESA